MKIRTDAPHYRFIKFWNDQFFCMPNDLCSYLRALLWAGIKAAIALTLASALVACAADFLAWAVVCAVQLTLFWPAYRGMFFLVVLTTVATLAILIAICWLYEQSGPALVPEVVSEAYKSFKNKTCVFIDYERTRHD